MFLVDLRSCIVALGYSFGLPNWNFMLNYTVGVTKCKWLKNREVITARKRSLRRLCFHRCLSVHGRGGWGLCPGGLRPGGLWLGGLCPGRAVSVQGGSLCRGVCLGGICPEAVSVQGGLCPGGSLSGRPPYCNERAVRILLECILVQKKFHCSVFGHNYSCFVLRKAEEIITYSIAGIYVKQYR